MKRVFVLKVFQAFQAVCIPNVAVTCMAALGSPFERWDRFPPGEQNSGHQSGNIGSTTYVV
jgi:hypothetical protein